ncbi:MAG: ankyrin repeat domain-containing protein [Blastocatellia bacterium]|nr:ankyrin repeat domain-containing protein [Blastocatellia bacterium]
MKLLSLACVLFLAGTMPAAAQQRAASKAKSHTAAPAKVGTTTALHKAVADGNVKDIATLIRTKKALVNAKDENGKTPLMLAAEKNDVETVRLLLQNGADKGAADKDDNTALDLAFTAKSKESANVLMGMDSGGAADTLDSRQGRHAKLITNDGDAPTAAGGNPGAKDDPTFNGVYREQKGDGVKRPVHDFVNDAAKPPGKQ